jgi:UDP-2-acetamido-3-amino-2,3-dideoxy-glucuronate N-acetyltransferase
LSGQNERRFSFEFKVLSFVSGHRGATEKHGGTQGREKRVARFETGLRSLQFTVYSLKCGLRDLSLGEQARRCSRVFIMNDLNFFAHPTAVIDEGCEIGKGTNIWHFCHLMSGCRIGENCSLGQNVFVGSNVVLGRNVKVQNNVSIYEGVVCEDNVFLGPSMVFTNVINPRSAINRKTEFRKTIVRKGATIGANATIVCGNEIGAYAFIGAGAVITKTVPAYAVIVGNPGRQRGWMSEAGYPLNFDKNGEAVCKGSGEVYVLKEGSVLRRVN